VEHCEILTASSGTIAATLFYLSGFSKLLDNKIESYNTDITCVIDAVTDSLVRRVIRHNYIRVIAASVTVIRLDADVVCENNILIYSGGATTSASIVGIHIPGDANRIRDNEINGFGYGIHSDNALQNVIDNNKIQVGGAMSNPRCVYFSGYTTADLHTSVCGNIFNGDSVTGAYGILFQDTAGNPDVLSVKCGDNIFYGFGGSGAANWMPANPGNKVGIGQIGVDADMTHNFYE
jgi:hypothetical protein